MLDFRIYTFLEVCKYMNFTKAAEALHITQPAVSQHIRYIEEYYQTRLFTFQGKKPVLTEAGEYLLHAFTTLSHDQVYLKEQLLSMQKKKPSLIFGATLTIGEYVMPRFLIEYQTRHPDTVLTMITANTHELLDRISDGEIDFAIVEGYFDKTQYDYLTFSSEPYIAVAGTPLFEDCRPRSLSELLDQKLIVREPGSGTREILEKHLEARNLSIHDFSGVSEIGNIPALKAVVSAGLGITFLYRSAAEEELKNGILFDVTPENFSITHDFTLIWQKGSMFASRYRTIFEEWKKKL
ncbi:MULTISPECIES: LysR family transcriptional regulator [Oscillospiraceae]|uniref:LysR family transcriptional regulator n=1 Tax=Oscillospiraceae TaxID=216572 RepID=UPI001105D6ED|nr:MULTISPECIES: LysR family transcriptional regulator [Oscillospiraceae]